MILSKDFKRLSSIVSSVIPEGKEVPEFKNTVGPMISLNSEDGIITEIGYNYRTEGQEGICAMRQDGEILVYKDKFKNGHRINHKMWSRGDGISSYTDNGRKGLLIRVKASNFKESEPVKTKNVEIYDGEKFVPFYSYSGS